MIMVIRGVFTMIYLSLTESFFKSKSEKLINISKVDSFSRLVLNR